MVEGSDRSEGHGSESFYNLREYIYGYKPNVGWQINDEDSLETSEWNKEHVTENGKKRSLLCSGSYLAKLSPVVSWKE